MNLNDDIHLTDLSCHARATYNVLIADKIIGKFLSHKSRWNADDSRDYFYFFSKLGANGIKARLYHLLGNFFKIRAERMNQNVKYPLYGKVKKIQEFFMSLGERMMKLSESIGWTKKKRAQSTEVRSEYAGLLRSLLEKVKST